LKIINSNSRKTGKMTKKRTIPVDIVLAPEWWHKNTGITPVLKNQIRYLSIFL